MAPPPPPPNEHEQHTWCVRQWVCQSQRRAPASQAKPPQSSTPHAHASCGHNALCEKERVRVVGVVQDRPPLWRAVDQMIRRPVHGPPVQPHVGVADKRVVHKRNEVSRDGLRHKRLQGVLVRAEAGCDKCDSGRWHLAARDKLRYNSSTGVRGWLPACFDWGRQNEGGRDGATTTRRQNVSCTPN
jgi:hypothetical protein